MKKKIAAVLLSAMLISGLCMGCGQVKERVNEAGESVRSEEPSCRERVCQYV